MKKLLFVASMFSSALALSTFAAAADVAVDTAYDWSGVYIGVNAGAAFSGASVESQVYDNLNDVFLSEFRDSIGDDTAFTGGANLGVNWQYDSFVLGLETDFNYLGFGDSSSSSFYYPSLDADIDTRLAYDTDWYGTLRLRAGFASDNLLFFVTGGLAYGDMSAKGSVDVDGTRLWRGSNSSTDIGWTLGAGVEYAFDESWIVGAEYLYVDLGSDTFNYRNDSLLDIDGRAKVNYDFSVLRATLKYKF